MRRLLVLTKNEFTKIFAKKFVWILSIITVVLALLTGLFMTLVTYVMYDTDYYYDDDFIQDEYEYYSRMYEECDYGDVQQKIHYAYYYSMYAAQIEIAESEPEGVPVYKEDMYDALCTQLTAKKLQELYDAVVADQGYEYAQEMFTGYEEYLSYDKTQIEVFLTKYLDIDTYEDYLGYMRDQIEQNGLTEEEKEIEYKAIEYHEKLNPDGNDSVISRQIQHYRNLAYSLLDNTDYVQGLFVLASDTRAEYEKELAACEKTLDKGIIQSENGVYSEMVAITMIDTTQSFLIILLVILAGSIISGEISSGSIKSLIIAPVKRNKIIIAKFFAVASIGLGLTVVSYLLTLAYTFIFHGGFDSLSPYVTSSEVAIPRVIYLLIRFLIAYLEAMVYAIFAFMLSTLTKNTAVSVALPILVNMVGSTVMAILLLFAGYVNSAVFDILPFNHFDISQRLFTTSSGDLGAAIQEIIGTAGSGTPVWFSAIYLFVLSAGMALVALDSFKNKDILK